MLERRRGGEWSRGMQFFDMEHAFNSGGDPRAKASLAKRERRERPRDEREKGRRCAVSSPKPVALCVDSPRLLFHRLSPSYPKLLLTRMSSRIAASAFRPAQSSQRSKFVDYTTKNRREPLWNRVLAFRRVSSLTGRCVPARTLIKLAERGHAISDRLAQDWDPRFPFRLWSTGSSFSLHRLLKVGREGRGRGEGSADGQSLLRRIPGLCVLACKQGRKVFLPVNLPVRRSAGQTRGRSNAESEEY